MILINFFKNPVLSFLAFVLTMLGVELTILRDVRATLILNHRTCYHMQNSSFCIVSVKLALLIARIPLPQTNLARKTAQLPGGN